MNTTHSSATDLAAKHFARRITARLNEGAANLPYDISERLRASREQAIAQRKKNRRSAHHSRSHGQHTPQP